MLSTVLLFVFSTECIKPLLKTVGLSNLQLSAFSVTTDHGPQDILLDLYGDGGNGWIPAGTELNEWIKVGVQSASTTSHYTQLTLQAPRPV